MKVYVQHRLAVVLVCTMAKYILYVQMYELLFGKRNNLVKQ